MEITTSSKRINDAAGISENEYVMCMAPMMTLVSKGCSKEYWETACRQAWKNDQSVRENFENIFRKPQPNTSHNDVVGNQFIADMVPNMMQLNKEGLSKEDCEIIACVLWQKDAGFRMEYQKNCAKRALVEHKKLDNLPEHALNIIGAFTKRSGKDTLKCVNKALNAKVISQDELYKRYNKAVDYAIKHKDSTEQNRLLCYNTFRPNAHQELREAVNNSNPNLRLIEHCIVLAKRYVDFNKVLYQCIEAAMKYDNNADVLKLLIAAEKKPNGFGWDKEVPLMLQAMKQGNIPMMRVLVNYGVDINAIYEGLTLLEHAVHEGKIELVEELIAYPSLDIDKKNGWGETALFLAVQNIKPFTQSHDIIRALLNAGADPECGEYNWIMRYSAEKLVAKEMRRSVSELERMCYWERQGALSFAGSDSKLADIISLIRDAVDKKHHSWIDPAAVGGLSAGLIFVVLPVTAAIYFTK